MFESDRAEKLAGLENAAPRRQSMGFDTIWSTQPPRDQRQFSLDALTPVCDSPARPPTTPMPQIDKRNVHPGRLDLASCEGSVITVAGQFRDPYPAGLGLLDSYGNTMRNADRYDNYAATMPQAHSSGQHQTPYWQNGPDSALSGNSPLHYALPQMNFPSTPNFSSQNVLPQFQHMINETPYTGHGPMSQSFSNPLASQPVFPEKHGLHYSIGRSPSRYAELPGFIDDSGPGKCGNRDEIDYTPLENFQKLQINAEPPSTKIQTARHDLSAHMRRHSFNDSFREKEVDTFCAQRAESTDLGRISARVGQYFNRDPHERVKIDYACICARLEKERELLAPQFGLPDFDFDEYLTTCRLVLVSFKAGRLDVFYVPPEPRELLFLQAEDLVIVEADRGKDLGKIVRANISWEEARVLKMLLYLEKHSVFSEKSTRDFQLRTLQPHDSRPGNNNYNYIRALDSPEEVLGLASQSEIGQILTKRQDEERACRVSLETIADVISANCRSDGYKESSYLKCDELKQMEIIDAEYQFDRKKLTLYYSSQRRLDFRGLVRELFQVFKTRIWMCAVLGIPYKLNRTAVDRRHSQAGRSDSIRGKPMYPRERSLSRISMTPRVQSLQQAQPQYSPEIANVRPMFQRNTTQEYVGKSVVASINGGTSKGESRDNRYMNESRVPRNEQKTAESDGDEKYVMKSLVDTLNH